MFGRHSIRITPDLHERVAAAAKRGGYSSVEEFAAHILEKELERKDLAAPEDSRTEIDKQLRGLGYIE